MNDTYRVGEGVGVKYDNGKPMMSLMPFDALLKTSEVFTHGAEKYSADNWADGMRYRRMADALLRHLSAWLCGEDKDQDSGLDHLAHMNCCAQMLYGMVLRGVGEDDRWRKPISAEEFESVLEKMGDVH